MWTGTFVPEFERNKRLNDYMEEAGLGVRTVRVDVWPSDRVEAFQTRRLAVIGRLALGLMTLFLRLLFTPRPDAYLVSYPGWFDVPVVKLVGFFKRRPVVFDVFISLFDTAVSDRALAQDGSVAARAARLVDRLAIRLSDRVIADCPTHAKFFAELAGTDPDRIGVVYLGADERVFELDHDSVDGEFVLFYGTFVPLQGVDVIVEAAALLRDTRIRFELVGDGQTKRAVRSRVEELALENVSLLDRMSQDELVEKIRRAALCLGVFGTSPKAGRVIPHKVFEAIACGRPVLTGSSPAVTNVFDAAEINTCSPGDARALADAIHRALQNDAEREEVARRGYERFQNDFSRGPQSRRLVRELQQVVKV